MAQADLGARLQSVDEDGYGEARVVAVLRDGDAPAGDELVEQALIQLRALAEGNYEFEVVQAEGDFDRARTLQLLKEALADPAVDVIYTSGVIGSELAGQLPPEARTKPVMTGAVVFSEMREDEICRTGTSTIPNLTFITNPSRVRADLSALRKLTEARRIHVVIEDRILAELRELPSRRQRLERQLGLDLEFVPATSDPGETLSRIPGKARAVYVTLLPRMGPADRKRLYGGLAERGMPNLSMEGARELALGAMASLAPDNEEAVARRTAVNLHQLLQGVGTENLPVYLPFEDQLVIDGATAREIGWSPDYETILTAFFVNEPNAFFRGPQMTIERALREAAERNAEVRSVREEEAIADADVRGLRSQWLPQVALEGEHFYLGTADPVRPQTPLNPLGTPSTQHQGTYGFQVRQLLLNDELFSNLRAGRRLAEAARQDTRSEELDAMEEAAVAYFRVLLAAALYDIEKEDLRLTENNLRLARLRIQIGAAEPAEEYRWEQDAARGKANLFQRDADRADALIEFNRILGAPREKHWTFANYRLGEDDYFFLDGVFGELVENQDEFVRFGRFLQREAVENSPELKSFDLSLRAQGILLRQRKRRFWLPEATLFGSQKRVVQGASTTSTDSQHESLVGFQMSYPVFEGGFRKAEVQGQAARIRQLEAQRDGAVQFIEQRALSSVNGVASSHPNIRLSRQAVEAAEASYESVQQKYSGGDASILDLLDAQGALLLQKQQSAVANYTYLQDIHRLQRAVAWFEVEQSAEEKARWVEELRTYLNASGPDPQAGSGPQAQAQPIEGSGQRETNAKSSRWRFPGLGIR